MIVSQLASTVVEARTAKATKQVRLNLFAIADTSNVPVAGPVLGGRAGVIDRAGLRDERAFSGGDTFAALDILVDQVLGVSAPSIVPSLRIIDARLGPFLFDIFLNCRLDAGIRELDAAGRDELLEHDQWKNCCDWGPGDH